MGITAEQFWAMTPRELGLAGKAAQWRMEQEHDRDAWVAWHIAALTRAKQMPALRRLQSRGAKDHTPEELERRRREHEEMVERMAKRGH